MVKNTALLFFLGTTLIRYNKTDRLIILLFIQEDEDQSHHTLCQKPLATMRKHKQVHVRAD